MRKDYVMLVPVSNVSYHSGKDHCHRQYTRLYTVVLYSRYPQPVQVIHLMARCFQSERESFSLSLFSLFFFLFSELSENKEA